VNRVPEVAAKLGRLLELFENAGADAVRLRGSDWFAWATAGGSNVVLLAAETGVAELLITRDGAFVLTDEIEAQRLRDEEITSPFEVWAHPWADGAARERRVRELTKGGRVLSDRPQGDEEALPDSADLLRWTLMDSEADRYRDVSRRAAQAMTQAMRQALPDWTEAQLAAAGAAALLERGLEPALVLTAGSRRGDLYRHVTVKNDPLGDWAMMVFCARGSGLYANITRFVSFGALDDAHARRHEKLLGVEARIWAASHPGARLDDIYHAAQRAYEDAGEGAEILRHHQGGVTGYRARERVASPGTTGVLAPGMALAWNPSLVGAKIEDTILVDANGHKEVLTVDPEWPTVEAEHGLRPAVLTLE